MKGRGTTIIMVLIFIVLSGVVFVLLTTPGVADRPTLPVAQPTPLVTVVVIIQQACDGTDSSPDCYRSNQDLPGTHNWQSGEMPDD